MESKQQRLSVAVHFDADEAACDVLGPVHLIPSLCCDESCSLRRSRDNSPFQSQMSLSDR